MRIQTVKLNGLTYEIENGVVYVIKERHTITNARGNSWRHRITSAPKIRRIVREAGKAELAKLSAVNAALSQAFGSPRR